MAVSRYTAKIKYAVGAPLLDMPRGAGDRSVKRLRGAGSEELRFRVEVEREDDGRWLADIIELPGVMAYGQSEEEALSKAAALAFRVLAERLEHGEQDLST